jgi:hypothetical protein
MTKTHPLIAVVEDEHLIRLALKRHFSFCGLGR